MNHGTSGLLWWKTKAELRPNCRDLLILETLKKIRSFFGISAGDTGIYRGMKACPDRSPTSHAWFTLRSSWISQRAQRKWCSASLRGNYQALVNWSTNKRKQPNCIDPSRAHRWSAGWTSVKVMEHYSSLLCWCGPCCENYFVHLYSLINCPDTVASAACFDPMQGSVINGNPPMDPTGSVNISALICVLNFWNP